MLDAKPAVFISHSEQFKEQVAIPLRDYAESLGMKPILVSESPLPKISSSDPDAKVDYYLDKADMFVALVTPDERIESGAVHTRHNITDELSRARSRRHLAGAIQVFKEPQVELHSNINPTYERLDLDDVPAIFPVFRRQAISWELIETGATDVPQSAAGPIGPSEADQPAGRSGGQERDPAADQAASALGAIRDQYLNQADAAGEASVARAHLAVSAALASLRSMDLYGVHELNGLFRERASVTPTHSEVRHIARTVVAHLDDDNAPGWHWLKAFGAEAFHSLVIEMARADPNEGLRVRALKLLSRSRRVVPYAAVKELVERGLGDRDWRIRSAALELLDAHGNLRLARSIGDLLLKDSEGASALLSIRARETPVAALRALIADGNLHTDAVEKGLLENASRLPATALRTALHVHQVKVQLLALRALAKTSRLRKSDIEPFLESDPSSALSKEAVRISIRRGWRLDRDVVKKATEEGLFDQGKATALRVKFLKTLPIDQLRGELQWVGGDGPAIYTAIGEVEFESEADQIRADLKEDFLRLRDGYKQHIEEVVRDATQTRISKMTLESRPPPAAVETLVKEQLDDFFKDYDGLEEFLIRQFRVAGLRILANHGEPQDAQIARDCLGTRDEINYECIRVLERVGSDADVERLLDLAERMRGDAAVDAARVALRLASDQSAVATRLVSADQYRLVIMGIEGLDGLPLEEAFDCLFPLLSHSREDVRRAATETLVGRLANDRYEQLIDFYIRENSYYFYNVVVLLDRLMYAPRWLLNATRNAGS